MPLVGQLQGGAAARGRAPARAASTVLGRAPAARRRRPRRSARVSSRTASSPPVAHLVEDGAHRLAGNGSSAARARQRARQLGGGHTTQVEAGEGHGDSMVLGALRPPALVRGIGSCGRGRCGVAAVDGRFASAAAIGHHRGMSAPLAELSSLATALEELRRRVSAIADHGRRRAATTTRRRELFAVERALDRRRPRLGRITSAPRRRR